MPDWTAAPWLELLSALLGGVVFIGVVWFGTRRLRAAPWDQAGVPLGDAGQESTFPVSGRRDGREPPKRKRKEKETPEDHNAAARAGSHESSNTESSRTHDSRAFRPKKKKVKTDSVDKKPLQSTDWFSSERSEDEGSGEWERKMSSKEKRQLRKERMKRKGSSRLHATMSEASALQSRQACPPSDSVSFMGTGPRGAPDFPTAISSCKYTRPQDFGTTGQQAVEWAPPAGLEDDIFSHVGTWDLKDVKTEPVTFGTIPDISYNSSPQPSSSSRKWRTKMTSLNVEEAWLSLEDPLDVDQTSDWRPPREEWGNWDGDTGMLGHNGLQGPGAGRKQKGKLEVMAAPESKVTPNQGFADDNTKKYRRKKRRMRKTT